MRRIAEHKRLTSRLIKARNAVKLKHKLLKDGVAREDLFARKLTAPLKEILTSSNATTAPVVNTMAEVDKSSKIRLAKRLWTTGGQRRRGRRIHRKRERLQHAGEDFWPLTRGKNEGEEGEEYDEEQEGLEAHVFDVKREPSSEDKIYEYNPPPTPTPKPAAVRNRTSMDPNEFATPTGSAAAEGRRGSHHKRVLDVSSKTTTPMQQHQHQRELSPRDHLLVASKTPDYSAQIENYLRLFNIYARPYLRNMLTGDGEGLDTVYGPRIANSGQLTLGNNTLRLDRDNVYLADGKVHVPATEGVMNLLFLKDPPSGSYTGEDLAYYRDLLIHSNVVRQGFSVLRSFNTSGMKYKTLLKRLLNPDGGTSSSATFDSSRDMQPRIGKGMIASSSVKPRFIYFDDPNELVNRLRLLMASQAAGHTAHDPEVASIIEELKEGGYIW